MSITTKIYGGLKNEQRRTAFVLSGGGARGSYQGGVLKAAIEYGFFPEIITGTSIGAMNGAAFIQGITDYMEDLWHNISFEMLFGNVQHKNHENLRKSDNKIDDLGPVTKFMLQWMWLQHCSKKDKNGRLRALGKSIGYPIEGLNQIVREKFDEKKIRESNIEFALNSTKVFHHGKGLTGLQREILTKEEIPEGLLGEFLLASSTFFPLFELKEINKHLYVDGGISNNIPYEPAIAKGANDLIVVQIDGELLPQNAFRNYRLLSKSNDLRVMTLKAPSNIGSIKCFKSELTQIGFKAGYEEGCHFFDEYRKMVNFEDKTRRL